MKKVLIYLVGFGSITCCFAQTVSNNEANSHKWTITSTKGLKKGVGRLNLVFADSVEWSVDIYTAENKFIINRSLAGKHKSYELAPGIYHLKLNTVLVENVPIEAGKETRLKWGTIDITGNEHWELRSEAKDKFLTSGNKPVKLALPAGKYVLIKGSNKRIVDVLDLLSPMQAEVHKEGDYPRWSIKRSDSVLAENRGRLIIDRKQYIQSASNAWDFAPIYVSFSNNNWNPFPFELFRDLAPGTHSVYMNGLAIDSVPIYEGYETILKIGALGLSGGEDWWSLVKPNLNSGYGFQPYNINYVSGQPRATVGSYLMVFIPVGNYYVQYNNNNSDIEPSSYYPIEINSGVFTDIAQYRTSIPPSFNDNWFTTKLPATISDGRIDLKFPPETEWKIDIVQFGGKKTMEISSGDANFKTGKEPPYKKLNPGYYDMRLSNVMIEKVQIAAGYQTTLYSGLLEIITGGSWKLYVRKFPPYFVYGQQPVFDLIQSGSSKKKFVLPRGEYKIEIGNKSYGFELWKPGASFKF